MNVMPFCMSAEAGFSARILGQGKRQADLLRVEENQWIAIAAETDGCPAKIRNWRTKNNSIK